MELFHLVDCFFRELDISIFSVIYVLILEAQYPKADSGEATYISPVAQAKIGSKLF